MPPPAVAGHQSFLHFKTSDPHLWLASPRHGPCRPVHGDRWVRPPLCSDATMIGATTRPVWRTQRPSRGARGPGSPSEEVLEEEMACSMFYKYCNLTNTSIRLQKFRSTVYSSCHRAPPTLILVFRCVVPTSPYWPSFCLSLSPLPVKGLTAVLAASKRPVIGTYFGNCGPLWFHNHFMIKFLGETIHWPKKKRRGVKNWL